MATGRTWRRVTGGCAALLLAGCATVPRPSDTIEPWAQRLAALQAIDRFEVDGRIAASDGSTGFSAGLRWRQRADTASVDLTAPLGVGAAHIEQTGSALQLRTSQGDLYDGEEASGQLADTLGFVPPIHSLGFWLRGASDPALPASESLDAEQRLAHLEQDGWRVDYPDYMRIGHIWLPQHLTVTRGGLRLRLVINAWRL
jgi:outer membrane lipoprotein LolB